MSRSVFATAYMPVTSTGFGLRTYGVVRALAMLGPVDLVHGTFGAAEPSVDFRDIPQVALHAVPGTRGPARLVSYGRARAAHAPPNVARGASAELARTVHALARRPDLDRVVANGPEAAAALLALARRRPVVYNAHNVDSSFRHRLEGADARLQRRLERFERRVLESAAESWMVSRRDMELAEQLAPGSALRYVPNVVDVAAIPPVSGSREPRVLFVGDFRYAPNQDALSFLLEEVLPHVSSERPDVRVTIVGRGLEERRPPERVAFLGFVKDLRAVYERSACVAVPLRLGGGSPLKFVEALAYGLPVVATPVAAQGLSLNIGEHYREAVDGAAFARELVAVLRGDHPHLGASGRALAEREYSVESLVERLTQDRP